MTAAEDLACRYLALWQQYVTALLTDLIMPEAVQQRAATALSVGDRGQGNEIVFGELPASEPVLGAAAAAGPSRDRGDVVANLARRLADLEKRVAALEREKSSAPRAGGGDRGARR